MKQTALLATAFLNLAGLLSAADPQLLNMVMPDAKIVGGINVDQARATPFGQYALSRMSFDQSFQEFVTATGFDPRQDVREILAASTGTGPSGNLVFAKGKFDTAKLLALIPQVAPGVTVETYAGAQIIGMTEGKMPQGVAFLNGDTAIAGDLASVKAALDRRAAVNVMAPALATLVNQLSTTLDAWGVSMVSLASLPHPAPEGGTPFQGQIFAKIQQASGGVKFGSTITVSGQATADTPQDATALGDVFKFVASMVQLNAPAEMQQFAALAQNLQVSASGTTVNVSFSIPEAQLESLLAAAKAAQPVKVI